MSEKERARAQAALEVSQRKLERINAKIEKARQALEELQQELEAEDIKNKYLAANPILRDPNGGDDFSGTSWTGPKHGSAGAKHV